MKNRINFDDIWDVIRGDGGAKVFDAYDIPIKKIQKSPLRDEKNASFSVFWKDNELFFNDFAWDEHKGKAVDLVKIIENCNYQSAMEMIAKIYGIDGNEPNYKPKKRSIKPKVKPPKKRFTLPLDSVFSAFSHQNKSNNFIKGLAKHFDSKRVQQVCNDSKICTYDGKVIFLEMNRQNSVLYGQIMEYNPTNLKRDKAVNPYSFNWALSRDFPDSQSLKDFSTHYKRCFFNEHLLDKQTSVFVVESQKTAIIGNLYNYEDYQNGKILFVATSGMQQFKLERFNVLKNYQIIILPDFDARDTWHETSEILAQNGFNIRLVTSYYQNRTHDKWDYADAILQKLTTPPPPMDTETPPPLRQMSDTNQQKALQALQMLDLFILGVDKVPISIPDTSVDEECPF